MNWEIVKMAGKKHLIPGLGVFNLWLDKTYGYSSSYGLEYNIGGVYSEGNKIIIDKALNYYWHQPYPTDQFRYANGDIGCCYFAQYTGSLRPNINPSYRVMGDVWAEIQFVSGDVDTPAWDFGTHRWRLASWGKQIEIPGQFLWPFSDQLTLYSQYLYGNTTNQCKIRDNMNYDKEGWSEQFRWNPGQVYSLSFGINTSSFHGIPNTFALNKIYFDGEIVDHYSGTTPVFVPYTADLWVAS